jgi:hypothetical protein
MNLIDAAFINCRSFQQQAEAEGKWNRVTLSPQLSSYYTGYTEIVDCREAIKKVHNSD